jgi:adenylate cyclase
MDYRIEYFQSSAVVAVRAALQIQRELNDCQIRARVGLNAGEPIAEGDDFFGTAAQLPARITDHAEPVVLYEARS